MNKFNAHANNSRVDPIQVKYTEGEEAAIQKGSILYTGFVAQEVEKAAIACNFNFSGILKPANEKDFFSLSYAEFVVPLVNAVQELDKKMSY